MDVLLFVCDLELIEAPTVLAVQNSRIVFELR